MGYLERFAADYERNSGNISVPEIKDVTVYKWLGWFGTAGLAFAGDNG